MSASQFPLPVDIALFIAGAAAIWIAGRAATRTAQQIADRLRLGEAFVGILLLGLLTSLPEIATTSTAAAFGHAALAGSNLLGGVAMQMALLAAIDGLALRSRSLTAACRSAALRRQAVLLTALSTVSALGIAAADQPTRLAAAGGPVLLAVIYLAGIYSLYRLEKKERGAGPPGRDAESPRPTTSTPRLGLWFALSALGVFIGGFIVAEAASAIAEQSGISETIVGASLVAISTSLPELTTTYAAVRLGAYGMAVGNILGTNALELALFLPADLIYREGPIFAVLGRPELAIATVNVALGLAIVYGLTRRDDRSVFGFGADSLLMLALYCVGVGAVYLLS